MEKECWIICKGDSILNNILEVSELWAWAVCYSPKILPSHLDLEWIEAKKREGFYAKKILITVEKQTSSDK